MDHQPIVNHWDLTQHLRSPPLHHFYRPTTTIPPPQLTPLQPIYLYNTQDEELILSLKPPLKTLSEFHLNSTIFFSKARKAWQPVSTKKNQSILLHLEAVPAKLQNFQMTYNSNFWNTPEGLVPGHLPDLSDLEELDPVQMNSILEFLETSLQERAPTVLLPRQFEKLCDPSPIIPPSREVCTLSYPFLSMYMGSHTDDVKITRMPHASRQISLVEKWENKSGKRGRLGKIQWNWKEHEIYSINAQRMINLSALLEDEEEENLVLPPPTPANMSTLSWNTRGMARPSFKNNFMHLIAVHNPDIVVLSEIRVGRENAKRIIRTLPFGSYELVEPVGFSGGIAVLWNSTHTTFQVVRKERQFISGVIQVTLA